jgi:undecaprenyl-diphosphatase
MAGAAAVGLLVSRLLGSIAAVAAVSMAGVRVYAAARYPSDVLAGLLLGGLVAVLLYVVARTVLARLVTVASRTRLHPLVAAGPKPAHDSP